MKEDIMGYLFGGQSVSFVIVYFLLVGVGIAISLLVHYHYKKKPDTKFSSNHFKNDNWVRVATSFLVAYALVACFPHMQGMIGFVFEKLGIPYSLNVFVGLLLGLFMDFVIIKIRNKTSINFFQKK